MGLDWNPGNKAKPGYEDEAAEIVRQVSGDNLDPRDRRPSGAGVLSFLSGSMPRERLLARFKEITIPAYQTLNAPRVGRDAAADEWARMQHRESGSGQPLDEWMRALDGYYVVALVPPCDGLPVYSHGPMGYVELYSFRAEFLKGCKDIIGADLLDAAFTVKLPQTFLRYGNDLLARAAQVSASEGIAIPDEPPRDLESLGGRLHVVASAGRWCRFWAERGHILDPDW
jgi:hypothetical protein